MIGVQDLVKRFGRFRAVDGLDFHVAPGEAVALWGPNGAGKTTVIRCILGLYRYRGRITVAGHDARRAGRRARRAIGYVPQELSFYDDLRVLDALQFFARLKGAGRDRPRRVLAEIRLADHRRKRVRELSGGMKQRLALGLALLADPPLLLLDELTSNLDASARSGFMQLLAGLKHTGKTILFTSHRADEVETVADRVLVLDAGRLRTECAADALGETVGLREVLTVYVAPDRLDEALAVLRERGFTVARNDTGVEVETASGARAAPICALHDAEIHVRSFDYAGDGVPAPSRGGSDDG